MLYRDGNLVNKNAPTVMTNDATVRTGAVASAPASALGVCASCGVVMGGAATSRITAAVGGVSCGVVMGGAATSSITAAVGGEGCLS